MGRVHSRRESGHGVATRRVHPVQLEELAAGREGRKHAMSQPGLERVDEAKAETLKF